MLISISGSQGSGKSTILNHLKQQNYNIIERKTSRSILQDWNLSLEDIYSEPELTQVFQTQILNRKNLDELEALKSDDIWFTERSYADLFTYALIGVGNKNKYSEWLNEYYQTCSHYNSQYTRVWYIPAGMFPVEQDGVRSANIHYSNMVNLIILDINKQITDNNKLSIMETSSINERINNIIQKL